MSQIVGVHKCVLPQSFPLVPCSVDERVHFFHHKVHISIHKGNQIIQLALHHIRSAYIASEDRIDIQFQMYLLVNT